MMEQKSNLDIDMSTLQPVSPNGVMEVQDTESVASLISIISNSSGIVTANGSQAWKEKLTMMQVGEWMHQGSNH